MVAHNLREAVPPDMLFDMIPIDDIPARMQSVQAAAQFLPVNHSELQQAHALVDLREKNEDASAYLGRILSHQRRALTTKPAAAVEMVTNLYADFAKGARRDQTALGTLREKIDEYEGNPDTPLSETGMYIGQGQLARYHDLRLVARRSQELPPNLNPLHPGVLAVSNGGRRAGSARPRGVFDRYTAGQPDKEIVERVDTVLNGLTVVDGQKLAHAALTDQAKRRKFWTERLSECVAHPAANHIARTALANLGAELV